ncbi:UNVERIFIED_CONTAM: hypothetical protein FKN15_032685 [Acipenser sinensis]
MSVRPVPSELVTKLLCYSNNSSSSWACCSGLSPSQLWRQTAVTAARVASSPGGGSSWAGMADGCLLSPGWADKTLVEGGGGFGHWHVGWALLELWRFKQLLGGVEPQSPSCTVRLPRLAVAVVAVLSATFGGVQPPPAVRWSVADRQAGNSVGGPRCPTHADEFARWWLLGIGHWICRYPGCPQPQHRCVWGPANLWSFEDVVRSKETSSGSQVGVARLALVSSSLGGTWPTMGWCPR